MKNIIEILNEMFFWMGRWWWTRERWGSINLKKPWYWYDETAIHLDKNGVLSLLIIKHKQAFNAFGNKLPWKDEYDNETVYPNGEFVDGVLVSYFGAGTICSDNETGFGTYTLIAKLPRGDWHWPAWWLYSPVDKWWPPEIDIFEAYSKNTGYRLYWWWCKLLKWLGVKNKVRSWNIQSCIHTRGDAYIDQVPAKNPELKDFNIDPSLAYHKYEMFWGPTVLKISIDGVVVRTVSDPEILDHLSKYKPFMVLINNQVDGFGQHEFTTEGITPFIIQLFKYKPL